MESGQTFTGCLSQSSTLPKMLFFSYSRENSFVVTQIQFGPVKLCGHALLFWSGKYTLQSANYQKLPSCRSIQISGVRKQFYFFGPRFSFSPGPEKSISGFKTSPAVGCRLIVKNIFRKKSRDRHFEIIYQGSHIPNLRLKIKTGKAGRHF